jgi:hypothetical protein
MARPRRKGFGRAIPGLERDEIASSRYAPFRHCRAGAKRRDPAIHAAAPRIRTVLTYPLRGIMDHRVKPGGDDGKDSRLTWNRHA